MHLQEIIDRIEDEDDDFYIVAKKPWHRNSEALLVRLTEDYRIPADVQDQGYEYFLEVHVALEDVLESFLDKLTLEQRFEVVLFYAENDAYPEWLYTISGDSP